MSQLQQQKGREGIKITQQALIDFVQQHFPETGETEILLLLNQAVKEFCQDTKIHRELIEVTTLADTTEYALDADIIQVDEVVQGTTVFTPLQKRPEHFSYDEESVYWIDRGYLNIGNVADGALSALAAGLTVNLYCRTMADDLSEFVALLDQAGQPVYDQNGDPVYVYNSEYVTGPAVPKQYHMAPVYKVLADKYPGKMDIQVIERLRMSDKYQAMYNRLVVSATAYAEVNQNAKGFTVTSHWY